jgi:Ras-related GTP-binding protein C/D
MSNRPWQSLNSYFYNSSGKTSIVDFMFKKTAASATLFTESTRKPTVTDFSSGACRTSIRPGLIVAICSFFSRAFVDFQIWDLPGGQLDPEAFHVPLAQVGSVIYVLDGQVRYSNIFG